MIFLVITKQSIVYSTGRILGTIHYGDFIIYKIINVYLVELLYFGQILLKLFIFIQNKVHFVLLDTFCLRNEQILFLLQFPTKTLIFRFQKVLKVCI